MPKGYPALTPEQKQEITNRVKDKGERVADLAKEYGITAKTIYNLLSRSAQGPSALLEFSRLKRDHEALLKIIGQLVAGEKLGKKIQHSHGR